MYRPEWQTMCPRRPRRQFLALAGGLVAAGPLAGCTDAESGDRSDEDGDSGAGGPATDGGDSATGETGAAGGESDGGGTAATSTPAGGGLDLREANVVGVEFEDRGDTYRFTVALHHDDAGEEGYADWWQVERRDGRRLGRRNLTHPHARQPFERSAGVAVPPDVDCVVVRGHDRTHGYGGRAVLVDLGTGRKAALEQGTDRQSVAGRDCSSR
jgi:hypothetical protein